MRCVSMIAALTEFFLWFKALHVVAVFAWMAALFYLPRLFVYHAEAPVGGVLSEQFKVMERRLCAAIMWPAGLVAWVSGVLTAVSGGFMPDMPGWLWLKLIFVLVLTVVHWMLHRFAGEFGADIRRHGQLYYRILNEVPTLALIGVVFAVIFKPVL